MMKQKILSMVSIIFILLLFIGCGGEDSASSKNNPTKETTLTVDFKKNAPNNVLQKASVDEIAEVTITITKGSSIYLDNAPMSKSSTTNKWGIGINLDNSLVPFNVQAIAKDSAGVVLYKTKAGSTLTNLTNNPVVVLEELKEDDVTFTNLPSVKSITHNTTGNTVNIRFVINNATEYELSTTSGGTFNTPTGSISSTNEATLEVVYTKLADETEINLKIKLINNDGDSQIIPFIISQNVLTVNFPPRLEVNVEEQLIPFNSYKITTTVTDEDSTSWSYRWSKIRGAKVLSSDALTNNQLEIEALNNGEAYPLCFALTVTDDEGASSYLEYCIKGYMILKKTGQTKSYATDGTEVTDGSVQDDGFYQKGLTPQYTRDDVAQTVTDHVTGLVWQDDEELSTDTHDWEEANSYCASKGDGWYLPSMEELNSIVDYSKEYSIDDTIFTNGLDTCWSSTTNAQYTDEAWVLNLFNATETSELKKPILEFNMYSARCVRTKL